MGKMCICDIDGVIADSTKRFEVATVEGKIDWDKALNSNALHLDTLIPNAVELLTKIREHYDRTILLTSRYDHMETATVEWLAEHGVWIQGQQIITKPWDKERFTKTKIWKAQKVLKLLREASEPGLWSTPQEAVTELLIVEDEESNLEEIQQEVARWIMSNKSMRARYAVSLQDAVKFIQEDNYYERP